MAKQNETRKIDAATLNDRPFFRFELVGPSAEIGQELGKGDVIITSTKAYRNRANVREAALRWAELYQISGGRLVVSVATSGGPRAKRKVEEILQPK